MNDTVDSFPKREDVTVQPADDPKKLRLGWVVHEEVGIVIVNDNALSYSWRSDMECDENRHMDDLLGVL